MKIGTEGHPHKCVVCGDQQTYSIIINLKTKFPETFNWILTTPGDWHFVKLAAETIRDMLWDGFFHDFAKHECLLMEIIKQMDQDENSGNVDEYLHKLTSAEHNDEINRFWANTLAFMNSYVG